MKSGTRAGEVALCLGVFTALAEDLLSLVSSTHILRITTVCNLSSREI